MSVQTLQDQGSSYQIQSSYDGAVYRLASDDCVLGGIGNEFALVEGTNYSSSSLNVTFDAGSQAVLCGNFFRITAQESLTLTANSTSYVCARIDTSQPNGSKGSIVALTLAQIQSGNINGSDTVRDLLLYVITTNASGVTSVVDKRIINTVSAKGGEIVWQNPDTTIDFASQDVSLPDIDDYSYYEVEFLHLKNPSTVLGVDAVRTTGKLPIFSQAEEDSNHVRTTHTLEYLSFAIVSDTKQIQIATRGVRIAKANGVSTMRISDCFSSRTGQSSSEPGTITNYQLIPYRIYLYKTK